MLSCAASAPKFRSADSPGRRNLEESSLSVIANDLHDPDCFPSLKGEVREDWQSYSSRKRGVSSYGGTPCWQSFINDQRRRACRGSRRRSKTSRASALHTPLGQLATGSDYDSEIWLRVARLASLECDFVHEKRHCLDLLHIGASRRDSGELRCDGVPKTGGHYHCLHHQPRR
jgi:hypothetical protein